MYDLWVSFHVFHALGVHVFSSRMCGDHPCLFTWPFCDAFLRCLEKHAAWHETYWMSCRIKDINITALSRHFLPWPRDTFAPFFSWRHRPWVQVFWASRGFPCIPRIASTNGRNATYASYSSWDIIHIFLYVWPGQRDAAAAPTSTMIDEAKRACVCHLWCAQGICQWCAMGSGHVGGLLHDLCWHKNGSIVVSWVGEHREDRGVFIGIHVALNNTHVLQCLVSTYTGTYLLLCLARCQAGLCDLWYARGIRERREMAWKPCTLRTHVVEWTRGAFNTLPLHELFRWENGATLLGTTPRI